MLTSKQFAKRHKVTVPRIRRLCIDGRIAGAIKHGRDWLIPADALYPADSRKRKANK